jgi:dTDP-4-dehydrorhamnose reductase
MNKIVILGDGQLGSMIRQITNWECISRKKDGFDVNNNFLCFDDYLEGYDVIVNCIGFTDTYSKEKEPHWNINYKFVVGLTDFCNENEKKLVHISTDYLYSNSKSGASEEDVPVHCANWYGYTKLLGDGYVQIRLNNYLIIRCSFKPNPFPYDKALVCQVGNFDWTYVIAKSICNLIDKNAVGIYNVGTQPKTIYELVKYSREVEPMYEKIHETMPTDITMNCSKMRELLYGKSSN